MENAIRRLHDTCKRIETEWRKYDDHIEVFPQVVMDHISDLDLRPFGDLTNIVALLSNPYVASLQKITSFSDLHLVLWNNGRFHVEVLNWWGSDINIHDHNFSGVQFQLTGRSLNIIYRFNERDRSTRLAVGEVKLVSAEIWEPGDRSWVRPGDQEPHTVYHLSCPTVSLLIRSNPTPDYGPQKNYFPPSVSAGYSVADVPFRKKTCALRLLSRADRCSFHRVFREVIDGQTHTENLFTLIKMTDVLFRHEHVELLQEFSERSETERLIVESVVYRRGTEFLLDTIKQLPFLSDRDVLTVSVLAAAFDETSLATAIETLEDSGNTIDFDADLACLCQRLSDGHRRELSKILNLFRLYELRDQTRLVNV